MSDSHSDDSFTVFIVNPAPDAASRGGSAASGIARAAACIAAMASLAVPRRSRALRRHIA